MEISRPRPSILSLFDPLSSELDRATFSDSDKENDTSDFFKPAGTLKHIYVPSHTLKRRLVDVGDITVEQPDMNALLSDELEQEISYIVDDDENDTLTFRDMAKAATPKWSSRHATVSETPKVSSSRTPLSEISLKVESTPLPRKKPYTRQLVPTTPKGPESSCPVFSSYISSGSSSNRPPSYAEVPEVRVNDEPVPESSSIPINSLGGSSEPLFPYTLNQSIPAEMLVPGTLPSSLLLPAPCPALPRTRQLSPTMPADNANRYSVDLQTSFQIHFPSHDATFDLLKDKISFFGSGNEFDSYLNNLEGDSSLDDILIPGNGSKIEKDSEVSSTITLNQVQSVIKSDKLIEHPTPLSKDIGVTESSIASHAHVDMLSLVQPSISNEPLLVRDTKANQATFPHPHVFHPPLPLAVDGSRPMSTPPTSFVDKPRYLPPQIPALRIVKRSKTIKPCLMAKDGPPRDELIPLGCRVPPVTETTASSASSLTKITKKGRPSEVFQRADKANFPPSHVSNGPRRVLISEGPKLNNLARTSEQVKSSSISGPRRIVMTVPSTVMERASSSAIPPVQPSSGLRQPVKRTGVVKPVQRTAGSRLPAITRRIGSSGTREKVDGCYSLDSGMIFRRRKAKPELELELEQYDLKIVSPSLHDDPAFSADPHSNPYSVTSHSSCLPPPPPGHPVLKNNKNRPNIALLFHGTPDSDSDFQLVQPPNSPIISGGSNSSSPQSPMTTNPLTMYNKIPTLSSASSSMNQGPNPSVMSQGRRPSVLKKENKQKNFLSRSQSAQSQPITSFFSSMGNDRRRSDLPSFPGDTAVPRPDQHNEGLPTSSSVAPQILGRDVDQIDVLDETNPWGIRIHHDGPYEAAKGQTNKRAGRVPLGLASSNGLYNAHVLQANDQIYIPPQVTAGVSLNLSPGQILPRQFPSIQPSVSSTQPGPYTPHFHARPLLSPPNQPRYTATPSDATDPGSIVRNDLPAIQETSQHEDDISSSIGMAMLKLTDIVPMPSPHTLLSQAESPDEGDIDFFDQRRRVPSPPISTQAEPSRDQVNQSSQNTSSTGIRPVEHLRNNSDPPMYNEHIDDCHQLLIEQRQMQSVQSSSQSSRNSLISQNPEILAGTGPQQHYDNGSFLLPDRNAPPSPVVSRDQRVDQYTSPAQTSTPFYHSHRDGLPLPSLNYGNEPDVQSTHYSSSIYSTGQFQGGRRPPQHLPKRLVMPSPLNTGPPPNATASLYDNRVPPSQISSYVNVKQFHPTPSNQHYSHRSSNPPMTPMQYHGGTRAQDIPVFGFGTRKLRKKASVIVSFTPPIVEFHRNDDKKMAQSKPESKPKRLLSKGRR